MAGKEHAAFIALRGLLEKADGRVKAALDCFNAALGVAPPGPLPKAIRETMVTTLIEAGSLHDANRQLTEVLADEAVEPGIRALDVIVRASKREASTLEIRQIAEDASALPPLKQIRVSLRLSVASQLLEDSALAERYALNAAKLAESIKANRLATMAYHNLALLYGDVLLQVPKSTTYVQQCVLAAERCDDDSLRSASLAFACGFAAETGNVALLENVRSKLDKSRTLETDAARFWPLFGDSLGFALSGNWAAMHQQLRSVNVHQIDVLYRPLFHALRALAAYRVRDIETALREAYNALHHGRVLQKEAPARLRLKLVARVMVLAVLLNANRKAEATRYLFAYDRYMEPAILAFAQAVLYADYDEPPKGADRIAGYYLVLRAFVERMPHRPVQVVLTPRELQVLHGYMTGGTARTVAASLQLSTATVEWHANNIRQKLGTTRMVGAIVRARDLQLIP